MPVLSSIFFLTMVLLIGLFFFIRASVKDRTEQVRLVSNQTEAILMGQLRQYFAQRAYQVTHIDPNQDQITFEGFVRPSFFLAIFLTCLAALGLFCLALPLSLLVDGLTPLFGLIVLAPLTGLFYWKNAGRQEQVLLKVESLAAETAEGVVGKSVIMVTAHRDELEALQETLALKVESYG